MNVFGIRDNRISGYASFVTSYITVYDPKDVYGEDFPSETFRVLKEKETRLYGKYRTKRLVLETFEHFSNNQSTDGDNAWYA